MQKVSLNDRPFNLSNDGSLELFFLGVGSAFTKRNYQTNLLILKGADHLLIDCGTKCPQAFFELGTPVTEVRNILITHSHADHIGGLEEVALLGRYMTKRKPHIVINETYQHILWDMSLRGGSAFNEEEAGDILGFHDFFDIIRPSWLHNYPRESFSARIGEIDIKMMRTMHIPDSSFNWQSSFWSCGIIIDDRIMFTSDTRYDPELIISFDEIFDLEMIFHDCQFFTGGVHASLEELNMLPSKIKAKMYLTHYGDNWEDFEETVGKYGFAGLAKQHTHYIF